MADIEMRVALLEQKVKRMDSDQEDQKTMTRQMVADNIKAHDDMRGAINEGSQKLTEITSILKGKQEQRENTGNSIRTAVVVVSIVVAVISLAVAFNNS